MKSSTAGDASAAAAASSSGPSTSASTSASTSTADATHYIAKRVLRGSAVLHVAEGCFRSPDSADVVLAKVCFAPHTFTGEMDFFGRSPGDELSPPFHYHSFCQKPVMVVTNWVMSP